jgi:RimJ/RimL family protein N-acetyltransferase
MIKTFKTHGTIKPSVKKKAQGAQIKGLAEAILLQSLKDFSREDNFSYINTPKKEGTAVMIHEPAKRVISTDKSGVYFELGACSTEDFSALVEMYGIFSPKPASQGLPPKDPEVCYKWVKQLRDIGINFLARRNDRVIGHAALVPDPNGKSGEFIIFVDQNNRNLGAGTELTRFTIEKARELAFDSIWLTVENSNLIAIKLYRNFSFQFSDEDIYERVMLLKL